MAEKKDYVQLKIEIRDSLKNPAFRGILSEILLDLQKDVSGETKKKLNELFCELELHLDAYKKLKSWRWEIVSQGIRELTQIRVSESYRFITKFLNDKRGVIRKQAEIATVSLRDEGIAHFLDTTSYGISEWQQLKLMEVLRGMEHFRPPNFKAWLVSRNKDVVLFAMRLIRRYNQNEAPLSIIELVKHRDERIRLEAILCIKEFCLLNALPLLKIIFPKSNAAVKIEILETLATLGTEDDVEFIHGVVQHESSFTVKNKAQMALNEIQPETIMPSQGLVNNKELKQQEAKQKQDNERISHEIKKIADNSNIDESVKAMTVEVEEFEVFEIDVNSLVVEHELIEIPHDDIQATDARETEIEIGVIADDLDSSLNNEIGLVSTQLDPDEIIQVKNEVTPNADYTTMTEDEKLNFIELLEANASSHDLEILENIVQNETSSELRFRIFNIIKTLKKEEKQQEDELISVTETNAKESVFHELLEYASDLDSKCILLKQIGEIGDEKELSLLNFLANTENDILINQVEKAKQQLQSRLNQEDIPDNQTAEEANKPESAARHQNRIPLELCFLEEFGIEAPKDDFAMEIDFDLAEEFYEIQNENSPITNIE